MSFKKITYLFLLLFSVVLMSFNLSKKIEKKVKKEIKKTFDIEQFQMTPVVINDSIQKNLTIHISKDNLFSLQDNNQLIGYAYVAKAPSKTDEFDYLILLDKNLIVAKTKVLIYREDYGSEIGSKRWLRQFIGKSSNDTLKYQRDIMAISGATISASSMTIAINNFLQNLAVLHQNKVL
jgi:Na+-translocating ferredoxin:NAD+ oxidoreductase RnfG subunit